MIWPQKSCDVIVLEFFLWLGFLRSQLHPHKPQISAVIKNVVKHVSYTRYSKSCKLLKNVNVKENVPFLLSFMGHETLACALNLPVFCCCCCCKIYVKYLILQIIFINRFLILNLLFKNH